MNYLYVKEKATELLLRQKKHPLKTPIFDLSHDLDITLDTFSNYDKIVGKAFFWKDDSYLVRKTVNNKEKNLILYNDKMTSSRIRWSIAHEFGHAYLHHETDDKQQEIEAHIFASQLLLPDIVVKDVIKNGYQNFIPVVFGVSLEASKKFLKQTHNYYSKNDKLLLSKYRPLLNCFYEFYSIKSMQTYAI